MPSPDMHTNGNGAHPDEGVLHEWLEEQLAVDEAARVAAHVASCEECRERVAEAHGLIAASRRILSALDGVPSGVVPSRHMALPPDAATASSRTAQGAGTPVIALPVTRGQSFRWRRWGALAAVMLLAVTGVVVVKQGDANRALLQPDLPSASELAAPADRAAPVATDTVAQPAMPAAATGGAAGNGASPRNAPSGTTALAAPAPASAPSKTDMRVAPLNVAAPASPPAPLPQTMQGKREAARLDVTMKAAAPPAAVAPNDTLATRLEAERKRRTSSEAVAADAGALPRIDALGAAAGRAASEPRRQAAGAPASVPVHMPFDSLVLSREPCFGSCPWYDLYVDGSGGVRYQSHHMGDTTTDKRALLSAAELGRLRDLLERANVETLKSFVSGTPECGLAATDMPTLRLRILQRGRWYRVEQYQGCRGKTTVLPNLAREIDTIVGTQRWLPPGIRLN